MLAKLSTTRFSETIGNSGAHSSEDKECDLSEDTKDESSEGKIEVLAEMICRAGDEPRTKSAALLVLMATLENATHPKALANVAKHVAFTCCGDLNLKGMVDAQIAILEAELLAGDTVQC